MAEKTEKTSTATTTKIISGVVLLAVAGVAGGQVAGFKIEPAGCDECGKELAACQARDELISDALEDAKSAVLTAWEECRP